MRVIEYLVCGYKLLKLCRHEGIVRDVATTEDTRRVLKRYFGQDERVRDLERKVQKLENQVGHYKGELREVRGIKGGIEG